jgi:ribosomal protein S1
MTWSKRLKHPSKLVKPGDEVETVVLSVNPADRRISLGMKQLLDNPWENLTERIPPAPSSRAACATSPTLAPSLKSKTASTAWFTSPT